MRRNAHVRDLLCDERGSIIVMVALCVVVLLAVAGFALDMGRVYIERARMSNIADAGALAAARTLRQGQDAAREEALAVAAANGFVDGENGVSISTEFGTNSYGEQTVTTRVASDNVPLILLRPLAHRNAMSVHTTAVAAVMPIDLVMVLDQSSSLSMANAWDDLQDAATEFVDLLDDDRDQVGLVTFHIRAVKRRPLMKPFRRDVNNMILGLGTVAGTNLQEGLSRALAEMVPPTVRERSLKVVLVFTDGQPNAFRGMINNRDRIIMAESGYTFGYFNNPDDLPTDRIDYPDGCVLVSNCFGYNARRIENTAIANAESIADQIRSRNIYIYTIGLGNQLSDSWLAPDLDLLRRLANEDGVVDPGQPRGKMYFAPTPAELEAAFQSVASDLMTRLTK
jgi:Flp pilus assembly protein TadG